MGLISGIDSNVQLGYEEIRGLANLPGPNVGQALASQLASRYSASVKSTTSLNIALQDANLLIDRLSNTKFSGEDAELLRAAIVYKNPLLSIELFQEKSTGLVSTSLLAEAVTSAANRGRFSEVASSLHLIGDHVDTTQFFSIWSKNHPRLAEEWLSKNGGKLNPAARDGASLGLVKSITTINLEQITEAREMLVSFETEDAKHEATNILDRKEAEIINKQFSADPEKVLESIVANAEGFGRQSIISVVTTYLGKNEDEAYQWLNTNWSGFDDRSKEILAATSAKAAIRKNDIPIALEWSRHISDDSVRSNLMMLIDAKETLE
jgi:hypothetical protein